LKAVKRLPRLADPLHQKLPHRFEELLMLINPKPRGGSAMRKDVWRAVIEVGFIIFLFYSNLLMGEFERSGMGQRRGLAWAIEDVFTAANLEIAMVAALIGYILFEFLRKKF
jgi:hypothetical protein